MNENDFGKPRRCFLKPIPQVAYAADLLSKAVDFILAGNLVAAEECIRRADIPEIGEFTKSIASCVTEEIHRVRTVESAPPYSDERVKKRMPPLTLEYEIYVRDGWRCRFCGSKVISKKARKELYKLFPETARWGNKNVEKHHALAFMDSTLDHLVPHSRGGNNDPSNLVTACGPCQFGRGGWVLEEVGFLDPFLFDPLIDEWDGLTRLLKSPRIPYQNR